MYGSQVLVTFFKALILFSVNRYAIKCGQIFIDVLFKVLIDILNSFAV